MRVALMEVVSDARAHCTGTQATLAENRDDPDAQRMAGLMQAVARDMEASGIGEGLSRLTQSAFIR